MKKDRLLMLARLASGAAVVAVGPIVACTPSSVTTAPTSDGPNTPHVNAPAPPATDTSGGVDLAEAGVQPRPGVNAPPLPTPDDFAADAGDGAVPIGGGRRLPHGNALPPQHP